MLKRTLYVKDHLKLLVLTETTHCATRTFVYKTFKMYSGEAWFRLNEILVGNKPIDEIFSVWSEYVLHPEVPEAVLWINKYDLPKAEVIESCLE